MASALSPDDIEHFLQFGFVTLKGALDCSEGSVARRWIDMSWQRNGVDPDRFETWPEDKIHMPCTEFRPVRELCPRAFQAFGELLGGEERIGGEPSWVDGFIANYGWGRSKEWVPPSAAAQGWHKDGDFFRHFLDSPEQALLVVVLFSKIEPRGGGTFIACDSVPLVAQFFAERREGVRPEPGQMPWKETIRQCRDFRELTGEPGDVVLLHPFMLHTSSYNHSRTARLMINPVVHLKEPMNFCRTDGSVTSPVERAILRGLGVERLDFKPTHPRENIVPTRVQHQEQLRKKELERLGQAA